MALKFHQKSKLLLAKTQADENTLATPAATDAIAIFDADFTTELSSETFQYTGSELDRDEGVTVKDKFATATGDTFVPALSDIAAGTPASVALFPLAKMFEAGGGAVTYGSGTGPTPGNNTDQKVTISNLTSVDKFLTVDMLEGTAADSTFQNQYRLGAVRANVDLSIEVGSRAKLKWNFKGNTFDSYPGNEGLYPKVLTTPIAPNYGTQKTVIMPAIRKANITLAEIQLLETAFTGGTTKNISFSKLMAANLFGFDYGRFLSADEEGFDKGAVATDVVLTVLTPKADATIVPEKMLEKFYHFQFAWGSVKGQRVQVIFNKLQVMNISNSTVGNYKAKDITFRNTGNVSIELT